MRTSALDGRPELSVKITTSVRAASIAEILDRIEVSTGVKLQASRDIAADKVTISVKDQPAREVLRSLARCFDLRWSAIKTGDISYLRLWMDREAEAELRSKEERDLAAMMRRLDAEVQFTASAVKTGVRYEPRKEDKWYLSSTGEQGRITRRNIATREPDAAAMALQYLSLSDKQRKQLAAGKHVVVPAPSVSHDAAARMPGTSFEYWIEKCRNGCMLRCIARPAPAVPRLLAKADFDNSIYDKVIQLTSQIIAKDPTLDDELPASALQTYPGDYGNKSSQNEDDANDEEATKVFGYRIRDMLATPKGSGSVPATMSDGLLAITKAVDIPIVAQYVSEYAGAQVSPDEGWRVKFKTSSAKTAAERLVELAKQHRFTLQRDGEFILAKSTLWHRQRKMEIPEKTIKRWQQEIVGLTELTFPVAVEIANMSEDQIYGIIEQGVYWFGIGTFRKLEDIAYALKLYASLSPLQKRVIDSGRELPASNLDPQQRQLFMQQYQGCSQPACETGQDADWPAYAAMSLQDKGYVGYGLQAVCDMRSLGWQELRLDQPGMETEFSPQQAEQTSQETEALVDAKAKLLIERLSKEHPDVKASAIRVFAWRQAAFLLQVGENTKTFDLIYSVQVR